MHRTWNCISLGEIKKGYWECLQTGILYKYIQVIWGFSVKSGVYAVSRRVFICRSFLWPSSVPATSFARILFFSALPWNWLYRVCIFFLLHLFYNRCHWVGMRMFELCTLLRVFLVVSYSQALQNSLFHCLPYSWFHAISRIASWDRKWASKHFPRLFLLIKH